MVAAASFSRAVAENRLSEEEVERALLLLAGARAGASADGDEQEEERFAPGQPVVRRRSPGRSPAVVLSGGCCSDGNGQAFVSKLHVSSLPPALRTIIGGSIDRRAGKPQGPKPAALARRTHGKTRTESQCFSRMETLGRLD